MLTLLSLLVFFLDVRLGEKKLKTAAFFCVDKMKVVDRLNVRAYVSLSHCSFFFEHDLHIFVFEKLTESFEI